MPPPGTEEEEWKRMSKATSRFGGGTAHAAATKDGRKGLSNKVDEVMRFW